MTEAVEQEENSQDPAFANHMLSRFIEKIKIFQLLISIIIQTQTLESVFDGPCEYR